MSSIFRLAQQNLQGAPTQTQPQQQQPDEAPMQQEMPQRQTPSIFQRAQEAPSIPQQQAGPQRLISGAKEIGRIGAGLGARAMEAGAGAYGDIAGLAHEHVIEPALKSGMEGIKKVAPPVGTFLGKASQNPVVKAVGRGASGLLGAPTTEELRGVTKKLTGQKLEPKSEGEKFAQEFTGDVASFIAPGPQGKAKVAGKIVQKMPEWMQKSMPLIRGLGVVSSGHAAEQGAKALGTDEETGKLIKSGTMIMSSMFDPKGAKKLSDTKYAEANKLLPKHALANAEKLENAIEQIDSIVEKGERLPWKTYVKDSVDSIKKKLAYGEMPVEDLQQRLQDIGDKISDWDVSHGVRKKADPYLKQLRYAVSESLDEYGKTNPGWHKEWKDAQQIRSALHEGRGATRFIEKVAKESKLGGILGTLGTTAANVYHAGIVPGIAQVGAVAAGVGAAGYAGLKGLEIMRRISKSPVLQKYYLQLFQDASKENAKAVARDLKKIDVELQQPESSEGK